MKPYDEGHGAKHVGEDRRSKSKLRIQEDHMGEGYMAKAMWRSTEASPKLEPMRRGLEGSQAHGGPFRRNQAGLVGSFSP